MTHWHTEKNRSHKKWADKKKGKLWGHKQGRMTKKQEREFFGHKFEYEEQKLSLFGQKISPNSEEVYDIYCDKNGQIYKVIPVDETSKSFLNFYRGVPLKLLING